MWLSTFDPSLYSVSAGDTCTLVPQLVGRTGLVVVVDSTFEDFKWKGKMKRGVDIIILSLSQLSHSLCVVASSFSLCDCHLLSFISLLLSLCLLPFQNTKSSSFVLSSVCRNFLCVYCDLGPEETYRKKKINTRHKHAMKQRTPTIVRGLANIPVTFVGDRTVVRIGSGSNGRPTPSSPTQAWREVCVWGGGCCTRARLVHWVFSPLFLF